MQQKNHHEKAIAPIKSDGLFVSTKKLQLSVYIPYPDSLCLRCCQLAQTHLADVSVRGGGDCLHTSLHLEKQGLQSLIVSM
jgi:hypothetical protein